MLHVSITIRTGRAGHQRKLMSRLSSLCQLKLTCRIPHRASPCLSCLFHTVVEMVTVNVCVWDNRWYAQTSSGRVVNSKMLYVVTNFKISPLILYTHFLESDLFICPKIVVFWKPNYCENRTLETVWRQFGFLKLYCTSAAHTFTEKINIYLLVLHVLVIKWIIICLCIFRKHCIPTHRQTCYALAWIK